MPCQLRAPRAEKNVSAVRTVVLRIYVEWHFPRRARSDEKTMVECAFLARARHDDFCADLSAALRYIGSLLAFCRGSAAARCSCPIPGGGAGKLMPGGADGRDTPGGPAMPGGPPLDDAAAAAAEDPE